MKELERVVLKDTVTLRIDDNVKGKIKYICREIPDVEWSGLLFYDIYKKGTETKESPDNLLFIVKDVIPMDIGTTLSTEYNFTDNNDTMIDYFNGDPKRLTLKTGLIHSHHNLGTSFSGTDLDDLEYNCHNHNFYLSLIVNNWGDYNAFVGIKGTLQGGVYIGINEDGIKYEINYKTSNNDKLFLYNCNIENYKPTGINVNQSLFNCVKSLKDKI